MSHKLIHVGLFAATAALNLAQPEDPVLTNQIARLKEVPFEELLNLEVTSVSKRPEKLGEAPSAIQVITGEDIRRSGATMLAEALRLAPNLQVARIDARQWAVSARGFNATAANKLLVLIDGRTVYTPLFSGVFWDVQHVMLEDIDRIEVISGPGATLWGANAVNGVINVISKNARDTQGGLVSVGGGSFVHGMGSVRYGDKVGKDLYFRVYGMGFHQDRTTLSTGTVATNRWGLSQGGFRTDWLPNHGEIVTFQGNFYGGRMEQPGAPRIHVDGQNLLGRWQHPFSDQSDLTAQVYWDRTWRAVPTVFSEDLNTYDIELQHRFPVGQRHKVIWGGEYRLSEDRVINTARLAFLPADRNLQLISGFIQDEVELVEDRVFFTAGSKFEHNDYSGFEYQPSGRISWRMLTNQTLWAAVSRAVRTPSRVDTELFIPGVAPYSIRGGGDEFNSEELLAYELGYRVEVNRRLGFGISTFYNEYDNLRSIEPIPGSPGEAIIMNGLSAQTYGVELSATVEASRWWRLRGGYTFFKKDLVIEASDINGGRAEGNDPHHQFVLQSMINLPGNVDFDSVLRFVDTLNQIGPTVPSYFALDLRLAWRPRPDLEISVVGQNLIESSHAEFGPPAARHEVPRSIFGKVTWKF